MISTKGRYALRVMVDLAEHAGNGPVSLKSIAERQEISKKYLEIIVKDLVRGGLIKGSGGRSGGYTLCRDPADCSVGEIIELAEGTVSAVACLAKGAPECPRAGKCKTLAFWNEYDKLTREFLFNKRLSDFI